MSTIDKLYDTIDFLKQELEERNLLIRAFIVRDANDGNFVKENPNDTVNNTREPVSGTKPTLVSTNNTADHFTQYVNSQSIQIQHNIVNCGLTSDNDSSQEAILNSTRIREKVDTKSSNDNMKHKQKFNTINNTFEDTSYGINISSNVETNDTYDSNISSHDMISTLGERFAW